MRRVLGMCLALIIVLSACGGNSGTLATQWQEQYDLGVRYLDEGNYEEAIIAFNAAIEIDPKRSEAYSALADAYTGAGEVEKAAEVLQQGCANTGDTTLSLALQEKRLEMENSWKQAYTDFIEEDMEKNDKYENVLGGTVYQLHYINDDNIPELSVAYPVHALGGRLCTVQNGQVDVIGLDRGYFKYIKRGNLLAESGGNMDQGYDVVYCIEDGHFKEIAMGTTEVLDWVNDSANYVWGGQEVDQTTYKAELEKVFPSAQAKESVTSRGYDYWDILTLLEPRSGDDLRPGEEDGGNYTIRRALELDDEATDTTLGDTVEWGEGDWRPNAFAVERADTGEQLMSFSISSYGLVYLDIVCQTDAGVVFTYSADAGDFSGGYYDASTNTVERIEGGRYERVGDHLIRVDGTAVWPDELSLDICDVDGGRMIERLVEDGIGTVYCVEDSTLYYAYSTAYFDGEIQIWACDLNTLEKTKLRVVEGSYPGEIKPGTMSYTVEHEDPEEGVVSEQFQVSF